MPVKIMVPLILIMAAISWLAISNLSKADYFFTFDELPAMGDKILDNQIRVKGRIVVGSIQDSKKPIKFTIAENGKELNVRYVGTEPVPDMFKERAEAVVTGKMLADGSFDANHLQAKCASKYEAEAPDMAYDKDDYKAKEATADSTNNI